MRRRNIDVVVNCVRENPGISRAEIAKEASLAKATISEIVDDLLKKKVLQEIGSKASSGGRPAVGLSFNPSFAYVLGVCLDETEAAACLLDLDGNVCSELRSKAGINWKAGQVSSFLMDSLESLFAERSCSRASILSVGVAIPGPVDLDRDKSTDAACGEYDQVIQVLRKQFDCPIVIDSNTNMAAVAEVKENKTQDNNLVLVVRVGHAVRTALMAAGKILSGSGGLAGELGHIKLPYNQSLCSCGMIGCINTVASIGAMLERSQAAGIDVGSFDELVTRCRSGDSDARQIVMEAGKAVGYGLSTAINLIAPHVVIVCGPAAAAEELILGPLRESASNACIAENYAKCRIITGQAGDKAECYGAGLLAIKQLSVVPGIGASTN